MKALRTLAIFGALGFAAVPFAACGGDDDSGGGNSGGTTDAGTGEGGSSCDPGPGGEVAGDTCSASNSFGTCPGVYVCEDGNLNCSGQVPAEEQCNGVDDDCDGEVDEDFKDGSGSFTSDQHCGVCGNNCATAYANAATTTCDTGKPTPGCVIEACDSGFVMASETLCLAEQSVLCQPCVVDADCISSPGAVCVTLPDPDNPGATVNVCAQDCSAGAAFGDCPTGYSCDTSTGGEGGTAFTDQCIPVSGSCSCDGQPDGTQIFCSAVGTNEITGEPITCNGTRMCTGGNPGACELPDDICDGIDNDCDGRIDNDFRDATTGRYDQDDAHCGICGNDCGAQSFANATSQCLGGTAAPRCGPVCNTNFFDADGNEANGCECEFMSSTDIPDASGTDANCDGIDGEIGQAYFVSPTGDDSNPGTMDQPFRTVQKGVNQAQTDSRRDVLVAQGVYAENVTLLDGVNLYGGYSQDFMQRDPSQFEAVLFGQSLSGGQRGAVTIDGVTSGATLDGFSIFGANAPGVGQSSYAVSIVDSSDALIVANNRVVGGVGGPGTAGAPGTDGANGQPGSPGLDGIATSTNCAVGARAGGSGGSTTCGGTNTSGGQGGESHCPITQTNVGTSPCNGAAPANCRNTCAAAPCGTMPPGQGAGQSGQNGGASGGASTVDRWTDSNDCNLCGNQSGWPHLGDPGSDGSNGSNGASGNGCSQPNGNANATGWSGIAGGNGAHGTHAGGAGGGSAGSGFDTTPGAAPPPTGACQDRLGGSGGGGGAGGCRGTRGLAGGSGGGSFGIWIGFTTVVSNPPTLTGNTITIGIGGPGGAGGAGGSGGLGGLGGNGGIAESSIVFCAEPGGRGGNGGDAGHGGGGGGGCGGVAYGVGVFTGPNGFSPDYDAPNSFSPGNGGNAGVGGVSLGNSGSNGATGSTANTVTF